MASPPASTPPGPTEALRIALVRMLRPIVRLLISRSVPLATVTEILKRLYVEVADDEFRVEGKRQTDSRLHLLTGVHRKDVRRLRQEAQAPHDVATRKGSLTSMLIARWTTQEEYRDQDGQLVPLARSSSDHPNFEDFVRSVSSDIRPRAVLDEWQRLGLVEIDEDDDIHLKVEAFVPPRESEEIFHYLGRNTGDHLTTAVGNVIGSQDTQLERSTSWDRLTEESVEELRALANEHGMEALRAVNQRAAALHKRDSSSRRKDGATLRMSFGAWFFRENADADGGTTGPSQAAQPAQSGRAATETAKPTKPTRRTRQKTAKGAG